MKWNHSYLWVLGVVSANPTSLAALIRVADGLIIHHSSLEALQSLGYLWWKLCHPSPRAIKETNQLSAGRISLLNYLVPNMWQTELTHQVAFKVPIYLKQERVMKL